MSQSLLYDSQELRVDSAGVQIQGCQIFRGKTYQNEKIHIQNDHKMHQIVIKYTKRS
jgi:hypothetical protein